METTKAKENIDIRACEPTDFADMQEVCRQPGVIQGTLQLPLPSKAMWERRLAEPRAGSYQFVASVQDRVIGMIGLHLQPNPRRNHVASIGMSVHDDFQGRGVGHQLLSHVIGFAENWLGIERIELTVYTDNARAIALYERHGFVREGTHLSFARRDGQLIDAYAMARVTCRT